MDKGERTQRRDDIYRSKQDTMRALFVSLALLALQKEFCMHEVLNEVYLQNLSQMGITFRDESNEPSSIMIGYSNATITIL